MNAGLTDSDDLHANNKRTMLTRAKDKILAVDSSKFDQVAFAEIGSLDQITLSLRMQSRKQDGFSILIRSVLNVSIQSKEGQL